MYNNINYTSPAKSTFQVALLGAYLSGVHDIVIMSSKRIIVHKPV